MHFHKRSLTIAAAYRLDQKKHLKGLSDPVARFPLNKVRSAVTTSGQFRLVGGVRPEQVCVGAFRNLLVLTCKTHYIFILVFMVIVTIFICVDLKYFMFLLSMAFCELLVRLTAVEGRIFAFQGPGNGSIIKWDIS